MMFNLAASIADGHIILIGVLLIISIAYLLYALGRIWRRQSLSRVGESVRGLAHRTDDMGNCRAG